MKIKRILIIIFLIGIVILVVLTIFKLNGSKNIFKRYEVEQLESERQLNNSIKIESEENKKSKKDVNENQKERNDNIVNEVNSDKSSILDTDEELKMLNDIDLSYYTQLNWKVEDIVIKEEKEGLSFFDRIDGKKARVSKEVRKEIKWLMNIEDEDSYVKNSFVLIPISTSSDMAYKYYFDNKGYLVTDNLSKDWTVLDKYGREIDEELKPVKYYIGNKDYSIEYIEKICDSKEDVYYIDKNKSINSTPSQIIITEGVVFRNKLEKVFNTLIDRDMSKYIVSGSGYQKKVNGKIFTNTKIKDALKLKSNGSYVVFNNYINNFNKITCKVAMEYTASSKRDTRCQIVFYDKNEYDKGNLDEYLFENDKFNYTGIVPISFTFDRSVKEIVAVLYVTGEYKERSIYLKDMRFGFSKSAYRDELIRKKENQEEIDYLKSLGLYVEEDGYFDIIDEEGEIIDEIDEEIEDIEDFFDSEKYYDNLVNKNTGPAFDKDLQKISNIRKGPYYDIVGTSSEIKNKSRKAKVIYTK